MAPLLGVGLGLVISKELIEKMNGKLTVESEIGNGSCFWIKVPKADIELY